MNGGTDEESNQGEDFSKHEETSATEKNARGAAHRMRDVLSATQAFRSGNEFTVVQENHVREPFLPETRRHHVAGFFRGDREPKHTVRT